MTIETEIVNLSTQTTALLDAVNVAKITLDQKVDVASDQAAIALANAAGSIVSAGQSAGSAAQALAIYGTTAAMNTALQTAAAQSQLAQTAAASASSILQQDLSAVSAALHRSPNAITAMCIYDTSLDSDGGAWVERMQHTSWYNEPLRGAWLGAHATEFLARNFKSTLGAEKAVNSAFDTDSAWTKGAGWAISGGVATRTSGAGSGSVSQLSDLTAGTFYLVTVKVDSNSGGAIYARFTGGTTVTSAALALGESSFYMQALSGNTAFEIYANLTAAAVVTSASIKEVVFTTATGDYFQLTTDGKFYKLNAGAGITEVFRGNKAKFPRLAAIVAEAGSVTIYDLTQPGQPMFMRFVGANNKALYIGAGGGVTSIASLNGELAFGCGLASGLSRVSFTKDHASFVYADGTYVRPDTTLAARNTVGVVANRAGIAIANSAVNSVAMTVLPDAPFDAATGLQVPTIAVATNGGVSVIKHDGAVKNLNIASNSNLDIAFNGKRLYVAGVPSSNNGIFSTNDINDATVGAFNYFAFYGMHQFDMTTHNDATRFEYAVATKVLASRPAGGAYLSFLRENFSTGTKSIAARITDKFSTGYKVGDIRRAYLCNTEVESVSGAELVVNGSDPVDTAGWTTSLSGAGTFLASGGEFVFGGAGGANDTAGQSVPTVVGRQYKVSVTARCGAGSYAAIVRNAGETVSTAGTSNITLSFTFTATATAHIIYVRGNGSGSAYFNNFSVKEVVQDRSYKAAGASIYGTLVKSPVAV